MMKKLFIFILAFVLAILLFAAPAWATVTISATDLGGGEVAISYVTDGNLPRAFGLDITVTDGDITACEPNMVGECTATVRGYGIFMGTIAIEADGTISDYGTPVAPSSYPGTLRITITEMCTVNIAGNTARCGTEGVVMEDWEEVPVVTYVPTDVGIDEMPVGSTIGDIYITQAIHDLWVSIGRPVIWLCVGNSRGDANNDGFTNPTDVGMIINALGQATTNANCAADLNRDGFINPTDVGQIINNLGVNHGGPCP
ncbi:MAG: dockerin type I domain-containing protein [Planctomycetota bacterium]|jgi:hypothetical protein